MMSEIKNEIEKFWDNKDSINFSDEDLKKKILSVLASLDSGELRV